MRKIIHIFISAWTWLKPQSPLQSVNSFSLTDHRHLFCREFVSASSLGNQISRYDRIFPHLCQPHFSADKSLCSEWIWHNWVRFCLCLLQNFIFQRWCTQLPEELCAHPNQESFLYYSSPLDTRELSFSALNMPPSYQAAEFTWAVYQPKKCALLNIQISMCYLLSCIEHGTTFEQQFYILVCCVNKWG